MSQDDWEDSNTLPTFAPLKRIRAVFRYRFGWVAATALLTSFVLLQIYNPGEFDQWMLGAVTFVLLAVGGLPEGVLGSDATSTHFDDWLPEYNGLNRTGLILAFILTLAVAFKGQLGELVPAEPIVDGLMHLNAATAGWIVLRRVIFWLSMGIKRLPIIGRYLGWIRPQRIYWILIVCSLFLFLYSVNINNIDQFKDDFLKIIGLTAIFIPSIVGRHRILNLSDIKTIATHISVMEFLAIFIVLYLGGDGELFLNIIVSLWPVDFALDGEEEELIKLGVTAILLALIVNLRRNLVTPSNVSHSPAALSIYPSSATYVDDDGYETDVANLISNSNGGVVGITGVRGAGKSALLTKLKDRFNEHFCVVWTVAPVSHRGGDDLSFLMSVSRTLCQKVIDDLNDVLFGKRNTVQKAGEEFLRRIRIPGVTLAVIVGGSLLLRGPGGETRDFFGQPLPTPTAFRMGGERFELNSSVISASFQQALDAERLVIRRLTARINDVLPEEVDNQEEQASAKFFAIVPLVQHRGFSLVSRDSPAINNDVMLDNHEWLASDIRDVRDYNEIRREFILIDQISLLDNQIYGIDKIAKLFILNNGDIVKFNQLQKFFSRQIVGGTKSFYESISNAKADSWLSPYFESQLIGLSILRGYPGLELTLGAINSELRDILKPGNPGIQNVEWASIVLLGTYLDAIDKIKSATANTDRSIDPPSDLFISTDELRRLSEVLFRYLEVLDGKTLNAGIYDTVDADGTVPGFFDNFAARLATMGALYTWILLTILILAIAPELWRAGNFVLRGLLNHKLLVLMRESDEFLEELHYSEGREASAGFTLKGLFNVGGKRTLTARSLTLQSLTDHYQNYVRQLLSYYNGKLIIVIDELDKIDDPKEVKAVLKEIKGALFQQGCYYLISISEDCAKAFRGRLAEGRDIFESTFEDVISIRQMSPKTARAMVEKRLRTDDSTVQLSDESVDILTVFSGAIPREIVRHLRATVLKAKEGKSKNPKAIGRNIFRAELRQWMAQLRAAPYRGEDLILLRDRCQEMLDAIPKGGESWPDQSHQLVAKGSLASIGVVLTKCLNLLDPENKLRGQEIISEFDGARDVEGRRRFRQLAEVQACLRLMIMNALMRKIWQDNELDDDAARAGIECFRTVMQHPAIAEELLKDLAVQHLGLVYPEGGPAEQLVETAAE